MFSLKRNREETLYDPEPPLKIARATTQDTTLEECVCENGSCGGLKDCKKCRVKHPCSHWLKKGRKDRILKSCIAKRKEERKQMLNIRRKNREKATKKGLVYCTGCRMGHPKSHFIDEHGTKYNICNKHRDMRKKERNRRNKKIQDAEDNTGFKFCQFCKEFHESSLFISDSGQNFKLCNKARKMIRLQRAERKAKRVEQGKKTGKQYCSQCFTLHDPHDFIDKNGRKRETCNKMRSLRHIYVTNRKKKSLMIQAKTGLKSCSRCWKNYPDPHFIRPGGNQFAHCLKCRDEEEKSLVALKARAGHDEQTCRKCGQNLPKSDFKITSWKQRKGELRKTCNNCSNLKGARLINSVLSDAKRNSQNIGRDYDTDFMTVENIQSMHARQNGKCAACFIPIVFEREAPGLTVFSNDRIDNLGGYTKGNVRLTCLLCNYGRNALSVDAWDHCLNVHAGILESNRCSLSSCWRSKLTSNYRDLDAAWAQQQADKQGGYSHYNKNVKLCFGGPECTCSFKASVERLDNEKEHTPENCVLIGKHENYARNRMGLGEYLEYFERRLEIRRTRYRHT